MDSSTASSASQGHRILPKGFLDSEEPRDGLCGSGCGFQNEPYPRPFGSGVTAMREESKQSESQADHRSSDVTCRDSGWPDCKTENQVMLHRAWSSTGGGLSFYSSRGGSPGNGNPG